MKLSIVFIVLGFLLSDDVLSQKLYEGFGAKSIDPQLVKKFAPKPIPREQQIEIEKMLDVRSAGGGVISPDGQTLFVNWNVTGVSQVWAVSKKNKFPVQLTSGDQPTQLVDVTADGKYLILSRDTDGDEDTGLFLLNLNNNKIETIYAKNKVQASFEEQSEDGKFLYFTANESDPASYEIFKYDIESKKISLVHNEKGTWRLADKLNEYLILSKVLGSDVNEIYLYNEKTKEKKHLFGKDEKQRFMVRFGKNENEFLVLTNKFFDFNTLYVFKDNALQQISPKINHDINYFQVNRQGKKIFYSINKDGYSQANVMDLNTFKNIDLSNLKMNVDEISFMKSSPNGQFSVVFNYSELSPGQTFVYDWKSKELELWVKESVPEMDTSSFVKAKLEYYDSHDGVKIPMFVYRTKECEKTVCPVVVQFHGGPEAQSTPSFDLKIQYFLKKGFVFVEPNVRGSRGYGRKWLESDNGPKRLNVVTDIRDAGLWIKKNWSKNGVSPKVGVMGGSYGGYATYLAMTLYAGTYDAGSASVGITDLISFLENTAPYRRHLRESEYGYLDKDKEALKKLSPLTYIDQIKDPLQIIHGLNDPRVPAGEALQIYNKLVEKKIDADFILFSDEGHGVKSRKNRALTFAHTLEFFNKNLK